MPPILAALLAGLACLLVFAALGLFNSDHNTVTLGCRDGSKPVVVQVTPTGNSDAPSSYTKVTCPR